MKRKYHELNSDRKYFIANVLPCMRAQSWYIHVVTILTQLTWGDRKTRNVLYVVPQME